MPTEVLSAGFSTLYAFLKPVPCQHWTKNPDIQCWSPSGDHFPESWVCTRGGRLYETTAGRGHRAQTWPTGIYSSCDGDTDSGWLEISKSYSISWLYFLCFWSPWSLISLAMIWIIEYVWRSDWQESKEWLNLSVGFQCNLVCHQCRMHKKDMMDVPLQQNFRHDTTTFLEECTKSGPKSSLNLEK